MNLIDLLWSFLLTNAKGMDWSRVFENVITLGIIWMKLKPHLKKVEDELQKIAARMFGLESSVKDGFNQGEMRFEALEQRVTKLEKTKPQNPGGNYATNAEGV